MSAPLRRDDKSDDFHLYVPPWVRERAQAPTQAHAHAQAAPVRQQLTTSPPMAPGVGGPNIEWPPLADQAKPGRERPPWTASDTPTLSSRAPVFEGDVAIRELRQRLSLDPESVPAPPLRMRRNPVTPWLVRLALVFVAAAAAAYGLALVPLSHEEWQGAAKQDKAVPAVPSLIAGTPRLPAVPLARLVVEGRQAFANDPLPLGVGLDGGAAGNEIVMLSGLAPGTRLSAGAPSGANGWGFPVGELGNVLAYAPRDFVGVMNAAVDLRSVDDAVVDSQVVRLEWVPKQRAPAVLELDAEEVAMLMKRGQEFLKNGDISAARLVLRRAANAGNAQAALTIGATFDPVALSELGVLGLAGDAEQAGTWYRRAAELGSPEASRRLERLTRTGR